MAGQSSPFGQNGWIGRPWLARPSKGHEATDFLGINSCSTCKKVPKNAKFVDVYCFCLKFVYSGPVIVKSSVHLSSFIELNKKSTSISGLFDINFSWKDENLVSNMDNKVGLKKLTISKPFLGKSYLMI